MPFNIWCGGCNSMIAKGVRFNAEKKQVGNYYSTKVLSKLHANILEFKSDTCTSNIFLFPLMHLLTVMFILPDMELYHEGCVL